MAKFHWGFEKELLEVYANIGFTIFATYYGVSFGGHFFGYVKIECEA